MTSRDFCYWLQGFFEIGGVKELSKEQSEMIQKHLNLVFYHEIDPLVSGDPDVQIKLNEIHEGKEPKAKKPPFKHDTKIYRC